jgi:hypothetical protein
MGMNIVVLPSSRFDRWLYDKMISYAMSAQSANIGLNIEK